MREIKFKGKPTKESGNVLKWIYGDLLCINDKCYIYQFNSGDLEDTDFGYAFIEVMPDTVGQFIGLYDCEGKEIYEGDTLLIPEGYGGDYHYHRIGCVVKYDAPCFFVECGQDFNWRDTKIIGNIHEV